MKKEKTGELSLTFNKKKEEKQVVSRPHSIAQKTFASFWIRRFSLLRSEQLLEQRPLLRAVETGFGQLLVLVAFEQDIELFQRAREGLLQALSENLDAVTQRSKALVRRTNSEFFRPTVVESGRRIGVEKIARDVRSTGSDQRRREIDAADVQQGQIDEEFADRVLFVTCTGDEGETTEELKAEWRERGRWTNEGGKST